MDIFLEVLDGARELADECLVEEGQIGKEIVADDDQSFVLELLGDFG